ncbi:MAG: DUF4123 domain-containing protein [Aliivibrio sp.]|uniref:DUF4123 domain-containing protein n=1 Tax=Aliivibrio sp. TaxID=1872443 RepID=UPI001A46FF24|nr:DUF4123 domain-containing protein [Aliivibrio sp.]
MTEKSGQYYMIIDQARDNSSLQELYTTQESVEAEILYLDTPLASGKELSPWLVKVRPDDPLWQRWQQSNDIFSVISVVIHTEQPHEEVLAHLRHLLEFSSPGGPLWFRYYSLNTLLSLGQSLPDKRFSILSGPINKWLIINQQKIMAYSNEVITPALTHFSEFALSEDEIEQFSTHYSQTKKEEATQ